MKMKQLKIKDNQYNLKVQIPQKNAYDYDILIGEALLEKADEIVKMFDSNGFSIFDSELPLN